MNIEKCYLGHRDALTNFGIAKIADVSDEDVIVQHKSMVATKDIEEGDIRLGKHFLISSGALITYSERAAVAMLLAIKSEKTKPFRAWTKRVIAIHDLEIDDIGMTSHHGKITAVAERYNFGFGGTIVDEFPLYEFDDDDEEF